MKELINILFIWMLVDNILNVTSKTYRKNTIRLLTEHDKEMENYCQGEVVKKQEET